jgi:CRISPR-associated protein Cmr2
MNPSYMLIFTLGPVQSFIAQARKTRDLWLGSFLLSRLMEAALTAVPQQALIFPTDATIDRTRWIPDLPNRYVAVFSPTAQTPDPLPAARQTAEQSEQAIYQSWQQICGEVYRQLFGGAGAANNQEVRAIWERQTDPRRLFEIYWVIVDNTDGQGAGIDYGTWFKRAAQALDARKSLRNFAAQDEPGEKSTLSGEREALHTRGVSRQEVKEFWRQLAESEQLAEKLGIAAKDLALDGSERLDAIDTVKRFALLSTSFRSGPGKQEQQSAQSLDFPSTSTMAAATFICRLLAMAAKSQPGSSMRQAVDDWRKITERLRREKPHLGLPYLERKAQQSEFNYSWLKDVDGECAFAETFTAQRLRTNYRAVVAPQQPQSPREWVIIDSAYPREAAKVLKRLYQHLGEPTTYYALLQMDGDQMGTIIGEVQSRASHHAISSALSTFAREHVPKIVEDDRPGKLIYAGGDDVLALVPLAQLFATASALQQTYSEKVANSVKEATGRTATVSMGIAIAHHLMPLTLVRRMAREAEEQAKSRYGRNALVVTILWRSGNTLSAGCRWEYPSQENEQPIQPLQIFEQVVQLFAHNFLSPRCLEILKRELPGLQGLPQEARCSELARAFRRQWNERASNQPGKKPEQTQAQKPLSTETATGEPPDPDQPLASTATTAKQVSDPQKASRLLAQPLVNLATAMEQAHAEALSRADSDALTEVLNWLQILAFLVREEGTRVSFH